LNSSTIILHSASVTRGQHREVNILGASKLVAFKTTKDSEN